MSNLSPIELVQRSFNYLFDQYGFMVAEAKVFESFGNWVVVLQLAKSCRIRIYQDRGEIFISFGPAWSPPDWEAGPWYDISVVLMELGERINNVPRTVSNSNMQLDTYSKIVRPLIPKICDLFSAKNYEKKKRGLEQNKSKIDDETWDKLIRKD